MRIETVRCDGFSMDYCRFGTGEKTMVILPGLSVKSVMLSAPAVAKEYEVMQRDFTVYVFDRRHELPAAYTIADMARDTADAMRLLGLRDVYLFGASQGGMIALALTLEHPELVAKLALGCTTARVGEREFREIGRWMQFARQRDRDGLFLAFGEAIYPPAWFAQNRDAILMIARTATDEELDRFVILCEGCRGFDVLDRLTELSCPVFVIGARDDAVLGCEASQQIAAGLSGNPGVIRHLYDGFGHAAFDTAPDCRDRLYRFFIC